MHVLNFAGTKARDGKVQQELPGSTLPLGGSPLELLSSSLPLGGSRVELLSGKVKT